jgi:hypothetical protein
MGSVITLLDSSNWLAKFKAKIHTKRKYWAGFQGFCIHMLNSTFMTQWRGKLLLLHLPAR